MDASAERRRLAKARDEFLSSGSVPEGAVRDPILTSWRRSRMAGVAADLSHVPYEELDPRPLLVRSAEPVLERLVEELAETPVSVVLTDARGRLLDRREAQGKLRKRLDSVLFSHGFSYAEDHVGTNGVGTALAEGRAVYVYGPEHFNELIQPFACAGVPIRNPLTGRIGGLLDLSCLAEDAHPMMRALAQQAASDIERRLLEGGSVRERVMLEEFLAACRGGKSAVLAISGDVVMADARASSLLAPSDQGILRAKAQELRSVSSERLVEMSLSEGRWAQVRFRPVSIGGEIAGTIMNITVNRPAANSPVARQAPAVTLPGLVGSSPAWTAACAQARSAARRRSTLMLIGEDGTGKLALARALHQDRWHRSPFVVIDCADDTGQRDDELRAALDGPESTVVLRHLERLDPASADEVAGRLERLAQEQAFHRWRDDATAGPWVIGTLNMSLAGAESPGNLLRHFAVPVTVPALRHRIRDLHQLVARLLEALAPRRSVVCAPDAMRILVGCSWPGNVRQLEGVLREALARRPAGDIRAEDLPAECVSSSRCMLTTLETVERDAIVTALRQADGNRAKAAADLGISRSSLYRKLHTYGIERT